MLNARLWCWCSFNPFNLCLHCVFSHCWVWGHAIYVIVCRIHAYCFHVSPVYSLSPLPASPASHQTLSELRAHNYRTMYVCTVCVRMYSRKYTYVPQEGFPHVAVTSVNSIKEIRTYVHTHVFHMDLCLWCVWRACNGWDRLVHTPTYVPLWTVPLQMRRLRTQMMSWKHWKQ